MSNEEINILAGQIAVYGNIVGTLWFIVRMAAAWKVFTKAGEAGWKALVPFYNAYVEYELVWEGYMCIPVILLQGGGMLMLQMYPTGLLSTVASLALIAGSVLKIIGLNKLSKAFGHGKGFTAGLFFLEPIFIMILGFGKSRYLGNTHRA